MFDVKLNADYNNVTLDFDVIVSTFVFDVKFWTSDFDVKRRWHQASTSFFDVFDVPRAQFQVPGAQIGALGAQIQAKSTILGP